MTKFTVDGFASCYGRKFANTLRSIQGTVRQNTLPLNNLIMHAAENEISAVKAGEMIFPDDLGDDWELDCYSRLRTELHPIYHFLASH